MKKMTHASVFSGIGGPEVAATMLGWINAFHCEINPFGKQVLDYWYPNSKSYDDITKTDFTEWRGRVNVLTGGFPCQPFSYAGKRGGADDDRYLWPYMFRCIDQIRPDWVVAENVAGILTMVEQGEVAEMGGAPSLFDKGDDVHRYELRETFTLQRICNDLEGHGYSVQPVLIPACAVGAPHRRDRVFIIGRRNDIPVNTDNIRHSEEREIPRGENTESGGICEESCGDAVFKNTMRSGFIYGSDGDQGSERNKRNASARSCKRICGEAQRFIVADSDNIGQERWDNTRDEGEADKGRPYGFVSDATETTCNGWSASDTESEPSERLRPGQSEYCGQEQVEPRRGGCEDGCRRNAPNTCHTGLQEERPEEQPTGSGRSDVRNGEWFERFFTDNGIAGLGRWDSFPTVSPVHRGNDGLPFDVGSLAISFTKWRTEALKAYGNAIVPQVMYEIFRTIEIVENQTEQNQDVSSQQHLQ